MDQIKSYLENLSQSQPHDLLPDRNVIPYSEYEDDFRLAFPYGEKQKIDLLIRNQKHLIILGDAGIGKSTLLRTIASKYAKEALQELERDTRSCDIILPYLIPLNQISSVDIENYIKRKTNLNRFSGILAASGTQFKNILLLDGLDEIPMRQFNIKVNRLFTLLRNQCYFVITSRSFFFEAYKDNFPAGAMHVYHLPELNYEEQEYLCEQNECDFKALVRASVIRGFEGMLSNPLNLKFVIDQFKEGNLPKTKSDLFENIVITRLRYGGFGKTGMFYKILQDIGLIMELLERNFLTFEEFNKLISNNYKDEAVSEIKDNLNKCGLIVAGSNQLSFEHRSIGEFLAAEKLRVKPLNEILNYVQVIGTNKIKPSWLSTVSFLIELNEEVKNHCCKHFPIECLESTSTVFSYEQRKKIFTNIYNKVNYEDKSFLYPHPKINIDRFSYFLPKRYTNNLLRDIKSADPFVQANATILSGYTRSRKVASELKKVILDHDRQVNVRRCALRSLARIGTVDDIPAIRDDLGNELKLKADYAITIGILAGEEKIEELLNIIAMLESHLSMDILEIFRKMQSTKAILKTLQFLAENPKFMDGYEYATYFQAFFKNLKNKWNPQIAMPLTTLLLTLEEKKIWLENDYKELLTECIENNDSNRSMLKYVIEKGLERKLRFHYIDSFIGKTLTPKLAHWLTKKDTEKIFLVHFAHEVFRQKNRYADAIYQILKTFTDNILSRQEAYAAKMKEKERKKRQQYLKKVYRLKHEIMTGRDLLKIGRLVTDIPSSSWQEIPVTRKEELGEMISKYLVDNTPLSHLRWVSDNTFQVNRIKYANSLKCLRFIDHYNLKITASDVLIEHLFFSEHKVILENYFKTHDFKIKDLEKLDKLFDPSLAAIGLSALIEFVAHFKIDYKNIIPNLHKIIDDPSRESHLRVAALRAMIRLSPPNVENILDTITKEPQKSLSDIAIDELMKRQHLPTIMRLIDSLINGKLLMPEDSSWFLDDEVTTLIQHIRVDRKAIWKGLYKLVDLAIGTRKHQIFEVLSKTMCRINRKRTIDYLRSKKAAVHPNFKYQIGRLLSEFEAAELHEIGRVKDIADALLIISTIPSVKKIMIFVEGPKDRTLYAELIDKFRQADFLPKKVRFIISPRGGWANIIADRLNFSSWIAENWPEPIFVLVDSDCKDKRMMKECEKEWKRLDIPYHILQREKPEKYYPKEVLVKVFRGTVPISEETIKNKTAEIAALLSIDDIKGTDMYKVFSVKLRKLAS